MTRLFLDHNASTPLKPVVREAMIAAMDMGNPSSVHGEGRQAKALLETAREAVAAALDAPAKGIVFTSGGTEAINFALGGMARRTQDPVTRIFVSALEHEACLRSAAALGKLVNIETIPALPSGEINGDWLTERLTDYDVQVDGLFLVCIMLANNENGVIQNLAMLSPLIFQKGGYLFVDAVQAVGKVAVSFNNLQADLMSISAHKIGGPKGVGALLTKPGLVLEPLFYGGGQELRRRAGTENVIGIAGLGAAMAALDLAQMARLADLRQQVTEGLRAMNIEGLRIWGEEADQRLPNTVCFSAPGFAAETQVMALDLAGIAVSAGSACSSGKVKASHVVSALGANSGEAASTLRVSFGWDTPVDAAQVFLAKWAEAYQRAAKRNAA